MNDLPIEFSRHSKEQMRERGATEAEVITAIRKGESESARKNRTMYRKNFQFDGMWRDQHYNIK